MTNEEKAKELAIKYCKEIDPYGKEVYNIGCEIACCEMAEWKEQQMIDKACEWLEPIFKSLVGCNDSVELIEDFKSIMEEDV